MEKLSAKGLWEVLKQAGQGFIEDKVPKLSSSLAHYTMFSIGPMLMVIIFFANLFWGQAAVEGAIVEQLSSLIGERAAAQIEEIIRNAGVDETSTLARIAGFVALIVGATTVFAEIQDSINTIWRLRRKEGTGFLKLLLTRIVSFSIVVGLGFLLLVSLVANALLEGLMDRLQEAFPDIGFVFIYIVNLALTLVVTTLLFAIIYKVLPDAHIKWSDVIAGALFTAFLFMLAKFGITFYIGNSDIGSTFGAAGSLVVLLLWIQFSAMILYFGAEFTKAYAMKYGGEIRPNQYTVTVQNVVVESDKDSVQENEKDTKETQRKTQEQKDREH